MLCSDRHRKRFPRHLRDFLHRLYLGLMQRRQAQADRRISLYLNNLPHWDSRKQTPSSSQESLEPYRPVIGEVQRGGNQ
jgi:hypothetical protein